MKLFNQLHISIAIHSLLVPGLILIATSFNASAQKEYSYKTVPNDPINTRIYELENGLKVFLTDYKNAPKIQTYIAVASGSKNDPPETTGLAHYLEHMLFKGTDKFGTSNWDKEKELLAKITQLYEDHKAEPDEQKKRAINRLNSILHYFHLYILPYISVQIYNSNILYLSY
ncbi:MAG: insulinase family protein [Bacteroidetes bacterium]|nr:insulinase family protein [Bacteroidota bacterium]